MAKDSPEKTLLAAVLLRAVRDVVVYSRARTPEEERVAEAARQWIFEEADDDDSHFASFVSICQVMDLDHQRVRDRVRDMCPVKPSLPRFGLGS